ncbi:MAG: hypothetical protein ACRD5D_01620 [Candidatus Polarisedimenticolia bacterium]
MSGPSEPDPFYRAVEEAFVRRRGAPLLLSPRDWALIGRWKETGVPLRIVLQGIDNMFDAWERRSVLAPRARRINSLAYCRQEVQSLHDLYRTLHAPAAGRPEGSPGAGVILGQHLGRLARSVRSAMAAASATGRDRLVGALAATAADLRRQRKDATSGALPAATEAVLARLDAGLLAAGRETLTGEELQALEAEAAGALEPVRGRMSAEALASTRAAFLARALRRRLSLPRLTLFDGG